VLEIFAQSFPDIRGLNVIEICYILTIQLTGNKKYGQKQQKHGSRLV
jgi:hypothetical protein